MKESKTKSLKRSENKNEGEGLGEWKLHILVKYQKQGLFWS